MIYDPTDTATPLPIESKGVRTRLLHVMEACEQYGRHPSDEHRDLANERAARLLDFIARTQREAACASRP